VGPAGLGQAYAALLNPDSFDLTAFPDHEGYDGLVLARDIPFGVAASTPAAAVPRGSPVSATSTLEGYSASPTGPGGV